MKKRVYKIVFVNPADQTEITGLKNSVHYLDFNIFGFTSLRLDKVIHDYADIDTGANRLRVFIVFFKSADQAEISSFNNSVHNDLVFNIYRDKIT